MNSSNYQPHAHSNQYNHRTNNIQQSLPPTKLISSASANKTDTLKRKKDKNEDEDSPAPDSTTEPPPRPPKQFQEGDDVFFHTDNGKHVLGTVGQIHGQTCLILFGDGSQQWASFKRVKKLSCALNEDEEESGDREKSKTEQTTAPSIPTNQQTELTCVSCGAVRRVPSKKALTYSPHTSNQFSCRRCTNKSITGSSAINFNSVSIQGPYKTGGQKLLSRNDNRDTLNSSSTLPSGANRVVSKTACAMPLPADQGPMNFCFHCEKLTVFNDRVHCNLCERACHLRCLALSPPPLEGDRFWDVMCSACGTQKGNEQSGGRLKVFSVRRNISSWSDVVHLILSCLACKSGGQRYFDLEQSIIPFFDKYLECLHLPRVYKAATPEDRKMYLLTALTNAKLRFINGKEVKKKCSLWAVRNENLRGFHMGIQPNIANAFPSTTNSSQMERSPYVTPVTQSMIAATSRHIILNKEITMIPKPPQTPPTPGPLSTSTPNVNPANSYSGEAASNRSKVDLTNKGTNNIKELMASLSETTLKLNKKHTLTLTPLPEKPWTSGLAKDKSSTIVCDSRSISRNSETLTSPASASTSSSISNNTTSVSKSTASSSTVVSETDSGSDSDNSTSCQTTEPSSSSEESYSPDSKSKSKAKKTVTQRKINMSNWDRFTARTTYDFERGAGEKEEVHPKKKIVATKCARRVTPGVSDGEMDTSDIEVSNESEEKPEYPRTPWEEFRYPRKRQFATKNQGGWGGPKGRCLYAQHLEILEARRKSELKNKNKTTKSSKKPTTASSSNSETLVINRIPSGCVKKQAVPQLRTPSPSSKDRPNLRVRPQRVIKKTSTESEAKRPKLDESMSTSSPVVKDKQKILNSIIHTAPIILSPIQNSSHPPLTSPSPNKTSPVAPTRKRTLSSCEVSEEDEQASDKDDTEGASPNAQNSTFESSATTGQKIISKFPRAAKNQNANNNKNNNGSVSVSNGPTVTLPSPVVPVPNSPRVVKLASYSAPGSQQKSITPISKEEETSTSVQKPNGRPGRPKAVRNLHLLSGTDKDKEKSAASLDKNQIKEKRKILKAARGRGRSLVGAKGSNNVKAPGLQNFMESLVTQPSSYGYNELFLSGDEPTANNISCVNLSLRDCSFFGSGYEIRCLPPPPETNQEKIDARDRVAKFLLSELPPKAPAFWNSGSKLRNDRKNRPINKDLNDFDSYEVVAKRVDSDGTVKYMVEWKTGYENSDSDNEPEATNNSVVNGGVAPVETEKRYSIPSVKIKTEKDRLEILKPVAEKKTVEADNSKPNGLFDFEFFVNHGLGLTRTKPIHPIPTLIDLTDSS